MLYVNNTWPKNMWMVNMGKKVMFQVEWKIMVWFERVDYVVGKPSQKVGVTHKKHSRKTKW